MYSKPHLSDVKQLELLKSRGMIISDWDQSIKVLAKVGYYRFSAYSYPFREILPQEQRQSETNFRSENFLGETKFDTIVQLVEFDSELRKLLFEAFEQIEITLCARLAYLAGKKHRFIHESRESLDTDRCKKLITVKGKKISQWEAWQDKLNVLKSQAQREDYFQHFEQKYNGQIPIWVAVEFIDFGGIARLLSLIPAKLQSTVAKEFGITQGSTFSRWIIGLNYLRNKVAHHNRVWNRKMTYGLSKPNPTEVGMELEHLCVREQDLDTCYDYLVVVAYLMKTISPKSAWNRKLRILMNRFPEAPVISPEKDMGFPDDWQLLPLWSS